MKTLLCSILWASAILLALGGCSSASSAPADRDVSAASAALEVSPSTPTITFDMDPPYGGGVQQNLAMVAAATATVSFTTERLRQCEGIYLGDGWPAWSWSMGFSVDGGPAQPGGVVSAAAAPSGIATFTFTVPSGHDLAIWFETQARGDYPTTSPCVAWDSDYGVNFHFPIDDPPGWVGNASYLLDRATCGPAGSPGPCYADAQPLTDTGFTFNTWARQQAAITQVFFDVWEQGVTDFPNPDLWKQLDVQVSWRVAGQRGFTAQYVNFSEYTGNNARYAIDLRSLDPLPTPNGGPITSASECPTFSTTVSADGQFIQAELELFFTINGVRLPADGSLFHGLYQNYLGLYAICEQGGS